jgi:Mlc titration factor MtfA (ptsG expression regulator)
MRWKPISLPARRPHEFFGPGWPGLLMEALVFGGLGAVLLALWWGPRWRRKRALAQPLAAGHIALLERNVAQYAGMAPQQQALLQRLVQQFLYEKKFVGCAGLEVSDEMRLTIAGQACLLLLGRQGGAPGGRATPLRTYPGLHTILLYPGAFVVPKNDVDEAGVVTPTRQDLLGESWGDGRVVLSWQHVRRGTCDETLGAAAGDAGGPHNVVLHEFAHQLDSESGSHNGAPYLGSAESYRSWSAVLSRDFAALRADAAFGQHGVLDHYGATSPAEFFAVATESFFEQPHRLAARHPALFAEFEKYYRVDPRAWDAAPTAPPEEPFGNGVVYGQWQ